MSAPESSLGCIRNVGKEFGEILSDFQVVERLAYSFSGMRCNAYIIVFFEPITHRVLV